MGLTLSEEELAPGLTGLGGRDLGGSRPSPGARPRAVARGRSLREHAPGGPEVRKNGTCQAVPTRFVEAEMASKRYAR